MFFYLEPSYRLHLKDLSEKVIVELKWRLENDPAAKKWFSESFGLTPTLSKVLEDIDKLFPDTPAKLLKDVFEALKLYDLVDLMEKAKPRTLRPAFPLREIRLKLDASGRPTRFYSKVAVLIIHTEVDPADSKVQNIGSFFQGFDSRSRVTTVSLTLLIRVCAMVKEWREIESNFEAGRAQETEKRLKAELQDLQQEIITLIEHCGHQQEMIWRAIAMESEKSARLGKYMEIRKMKKKDRQPMIANIIGQKTQKLKEESKKFKVTLDRWAPSEGRLHKIQDDSFLILSEPVFLNKCEHTIAIYFITLRSREKVMKNGLQLTFLTFNLASAK